MGQPVSSAHCFTETLLPCPYPVAMAWRSKRGGDGGADGSLGPVEIFTSGSGMIVEGSPTAVSAFIDQMLDATKEVGGQSRHFVV